MCSALNHYCKKEYNYVSGEEKTDILNKIDAKSLGDWPDKNSVFVYDNVIIIKISDER